MDATAAALEARGVAKTYGHFPALRGVDLRIPRGRSAVLFGRNGAGKTTFLKIAATLARPSAGALSIHGLDVGREPEQVRRRIGFLSHSTYVYRDLSPQENLRFFARLYRLRYTEDQLRERLRDVGLEPRRHDPVRTFSRGLLQRVGLARVMLHDPDLLLLDEPYTGLDARAVDILNRMLEAAVAAGRTVLVTTHDLELGLAVAAEAHIIDRGRIVYSGAVHQAEVREAYDHYIREGRSG